jgi:predicted CXXCH cytochrome family protein
MRAQSGRALVLVWGLAAAFTSSSCVDEEIVYRDRVLFEDPPSAAMNMLGYSDEESKLTVCGNCHVDAQTNWAGTAHADAWETLEESGHAQAFCEGCHTVNELGNVLTASAGHLAVNDTRYYDVQCESCHGPGLEHVSNPMDSNIPLAPLEAGLDLTLGCGECHQGTHHPFVEEWEQSAHSQNNDHASERPDCGGCHTGEDALMAWGVNDPFLEEMAVASDEEFLPITCAVCHDPHGSEHDAQLRYAVDVPSEDLNLCMKCHHKRGGPDLASPQRGPHSPQGPLLIGEAGWIPPNLTLPASGIISTHGSTNNPKLCAGCHVNRFEVTDEATGDFAFQATGHLFLATPCLDDDGLPTAGDCEDNERYYGACAASGCHGPGVAPGLLFTSQQNLNAMADELEDLLDQVAGSEFSQTDGVYTVAEGALFNARLARIPGTAAHNSRLAQALVVASIQAVEDEYGVQATAQFTSEYVNGGQAR